MTRNVLTRLALALAGLPTGSAHASGPVAPTAPASALILAQWALFRRGENPLLNRTPVAAPTLSSPTSSGQLTGGLHATDPDGDRLSYTVIAEPAHGDLVMRSDGTFTYVPDPEFALTGGDDAFTVVVRDNDPTAPGGGRYTDVLREALMRHHPALASRLFGAHTITVTVPVTVTPTGPTTPPVVPEPPGPTVDRDTGAVSGSLGVGPTAGGTLVVTVPEQPGTGSVTVDPKTGTYTFTPTAAARRAAAGTPGADVVTFTVLVANGDGDVVPVTVTTPVDPGPTEVVAEIPVGPGVQTLHASPDGRRIYAVGQSGGTSVMRSLAAARTFSAAAQDSVPTSTTISIIDAGRNSLISTVTLPGRADELEFSPDGSHAFVTTRTEDRNDKDEPTTVTVIDVDTDAVVATLRPVGSYGGVYFAPDGEHAYLSDYMGDQVLVLDLADDTLTTIAVPRPQYLTFSPDGRRAYMPSITDGTTTVFDTATHAIIGSAPGYGEPTFGADGRFGYLVDYQYVHGSVTVIDTRDDSVTVIPVGGHPTTTVWFGAGGAFAYVMDQGGDDPKLTVIDTSDHSFTTIDLGSDPSWWFPSPDGTRMYITDRADGTVTVVDAAHGVTLDTVSITAEGSDSFIHDAQFGPDGKRFYVVDAGQITIFDTTDDSVTTVPGDGRLGFSTDGSLAYVLGYGDASGGATLRVISAGDDGGRTFTLPTPADWVYFNADATRAYAWNWDGAVTVVDMATGATTFASVGQPAYEPQFSPDGRQLYIAGDDRAGAGALTVIDTADDTIWTVPVDASPSRVTFSPDGHAYVVSGRDADGTTVTIVDGAARTSTSFVASPYATDVEFTPDGRFGYVFGYGETYDDGEIMFIDLADGSTSVAPVPAPTGIRFSADGRHAYVLDQRRGTATVISLDADGSVRPSAERAV
ncbi:Ig-like domain-containing protein [Actinomycetospora chibensis]|uniref:Ig-like domain-containing protein n=1 Tax=Actinomycetospora chibensis TaxID=663606 RepID=A0ABV9REZ0_9PSEU|nr:Ig-like domain-containing protein [Actinomycetospora chibensis]MDD7927185.1 Ig-like domain-containing protein [Actinomycetospora chibensis]